MTNNPKLPDKMSELLRVAVADAKKAEASERYILNMNEWHEPLHSTSCGVCMAGAVMAFSLEADPTISWWPKAFKDNENKLHAINSLRLGSLSSALFELYEVGDGFTDRVETALSIIGSLIRDNMGPGIEGRAPWDTYLEAADLLEKEGL